MKIWPVFNENKLNDFMKFIVRERANDVQECINLPQVFITGRKVGKVPSDAADVDPQDKLNDVNWDDQYIYILTTVASVPTWGRAILDTTW